MSLRCTNGLSVYRRLKAVSLPDRGIDRGVANLVRALIVIGIKTDASCAGHRDLDRHQHPWVGFNPFSLAKIAALGHLVEGFNRAHKVRWTVNENWLRPITHNRLCLSCHGTSRMIQKLELEQLRQSAEQLARYVFDRRNQRAIRDLVSIRGL